ncbi:MAG: DUF29 domain-containing protein [Paracraurococcus sp.]
MGSLYDADFLLWSEQQAALLRRLAAGERVNDSVDWPNLIEEVGDLGRSEFRAVESLLDVGLRHLILAHAAARPEPVAHWRAEARAALASAARNVTPSMLPRLDLDDLWRAAREFAADKLADMGGLARPVPETCPFTAAELLARHPDLDALLARLKAP